MEPEICVLILAFRNADLIERTLRSIRAQAPAVHVVAIENPSSQSAAVGWALKKHHVEEHWMMSENVGGGGFDNFLHGQAAALKRFRYVAICEGDVVLDDGALQEAVDVLAAHPRPGVCGVGLHLTLPKYKEIHHLIKGWVPRPRVCAEGYLVGATGFQFILFREDVLADFYGATVRGELRGSIALGASSYAGMSDTNLRIFLHRKGRSFAQTRLHKLDHIGWELYLAGGSAYSREKDKIIKKLRSNWRLEFSRFSCRRVDSAAAVGVGEARASTDSRSPHNF